jgi:hypothetical protein
MERNDVLHKASQVAEAMVRVNNALMTPDMATYQPERDRVEFYLYDYQGERTEHFRFEATRHEFVIRDVLSESDRWRGNSPDRALSNWASHILGYVANY